jgi:choline dehydrogenase-like flavoprotein
MAYEVPIDRRGRASGARYVDGATGAQHFAQARVVVLAASACESARILLNSKSSTFPDGLANSSGQVGLNLTDSVITVVSGHIPALRGLSPFNDDGVSIGHADVPWWGHRDKATGRLRFATEYHVQVDGGRTMPSVETFTESSSPDGKPMFGQTLRRRIRDEYGSRVGLVSVGGMVPNTDCRCELDPVLKDRWGIPVLRFHWKFGQQEIEQARHAVTSMSDMISAMGGKPIVGSPMFSGGEGIHELGTARMGTHPVDSVLNPVGQAWDVPNLYIADGASFAGHAGKNPTLTIMALAWRACDHLANSLARKEI